MLKQSALIGYSLSPDESNKNALFQRSAARLP